MDVRLIVAAGEGLPPVCELPREQPVTLGRHRTNSIVLQDKHASRRHAEIFCLNGDWFIRDCDTLNGTRVNGERITRATRLQDGHEIGIGDSRFRFALAAGPVEAAGTVSNGMEESDEEAEISPTILQADGLTALCNFMTEALKEKTARSLVERALEVLREQTGADIVGYLNLDPEEPITKVVVPQLASVDFHLSRRLTRMAKKSRRLAWLSNLDQALDGDSLLTFHDALCMPLRADKEMLGALHAYRSGRAFTEREARFCEVLAGYLATNLRMLRSRRTLEAENSRLREHGSASDQEIIGDSPAMLRLLQDVARVAPLSRIALITGESGSGKELIALELHRQSPRCNGPLVTVNCAAISATLAEAELFGHCEGAFSGAIKDRSGFFEQADEGTLFLDEIGELSLECQAKLLRVIEGKPFRPVGGGKDIRVDVRVIAATHRDLGKMVQENKFRQDLYFRLGLPIKVPPLRERVEDIPALVEHFLEQLSQEYRRVLRITPAAMTRLQTYSWPGNVRQLRAVLENAAALGTGDAIAVADLRLDPETGGCCFETKPETVNLKELEAWAVREALLRTGWNQVHAAELLGINRETVALKMKKYGISK